jgi:hypothetical protein
VSAFVSRIECGRGDCWGQKYSPKSPPLRHKSQLAFASNISDLNSRQYNLSQPPLPIKIYSSRICEIWFCSYYVRLPSDFASRTVLMLARSQAHTCHDFYVNRPLYFSSFTTLCACHNKSLKQGDFHFRPS